jgi:group I intron endonuclease
MIIYKIINLINGKIYVGQSNNSNVEYFGSGVQIQNAIAKYGKNNFRKEIIEECNSKIKLNKREKFWIKKLKSTDRKIGYNIALGGEGGDTLSNHPKIKSIKRRLSKIQKKRWSSISLRIKASETHKRRYKNPAAHKVTSDAVKRAYEKDPLLRKVQSKNGFRNWKNPKYVRKVMKNLKRGKDNSSWIGYVYVYDSKGKLKYKFDSIRQACLTLKTSSALKKSAYYNKPIKAGKYKGYKFKIKKK